MENGHVRWTPGNKADTRKRRFPPEILTDAEVRSLMDACGTHRATAIGNRALIALLYRGGLRISEALHLYPKDFDLEHGAIRVLFAKGGKYRTVGLDPGAIAVMGQWLGTRRDGDLTEFTRCSAHRQARR
jgi:integrase/recombinase XerD